MVFVKGRPFNNERVHLKSWGEKEKKEKKIHQKNQQRKVRCNDRDGIIIKRFRSGKEGGGGNSRPNSGQKGDVRKRPGA